MGDRKNYHIKKEQFYASPGCDIYEALRDFFHDYYVSDKHHEVSVEINSVEVTLKRKN